jgi:hypothetical protein
MFVYLLCMSPLKKSPALPIYTSMRHRIAPEEKKSWPRYTSMIQSVATQHHVKLGHGDANEGRLPGLQRDDMRAKDKSGQRNHQINQRRRILFTGFKI